MKDLDLISLSDNKYNTAVRQSILRIGKKYNLDIHLLAEAFVAAYRNNISHFGNLAIQCRIINKDSASFLVTSHSIIVSQFPIKLKSLKLCINP
ncbi:MAG: hypothetical protein QG670_73 [Thermoproteota archaeon]|nr:hypothetical protein [Thermoproteota archaeon]